MLQLLTLASPALWRIAGYALVAASIFGAGAYLEHGRMQKKLDRAVAEHNQFKGGVAALAADARQRKARTDATNARNKERADEENQKRSAAVAAITRRLRVERDDARRHLLSQAGRAPGCPDGKACFDRAEFERAYGELVRGVRAVADEGSQAVTDLDTAKRWARDRQ